MRAARATVIVLVATALLSRSDSHAIVSADAAAGPAPTFHEDVLPILQARCQECHRPGEIGPMPLRTYAEVRPWVARIREMVSTRRMPPWFSDDPVGRFSNDRRLSAAELTTILDWVDAGAPEGDPADSPAPRSFADGWSIDEPDAVVSLAQQFDVPPRGVIPYQYILVPTEFQEDRWVEAVEIRPTNRAVVHHIQAYVRPPESTSYRERPIGEFWTVDVPAPPDDDDGIGGVQAAGGLEQVCVYVPGGVPCRLSEGQARLIPAHSDLYLIIHYQAVGRGATDQTRIGFRFADRPPRERVRNFFLANLGLRIPPGAPQHRVAARVTLAKPARLVSLMPHMHLRGSAFHFRLTYPDGRSELILNVPRYEPHWQLTYYLAEPRMLPAGTIIEAVGTFDNSPGNPHNPDPTREVRWGLQSWEEMHTGFFDLALPVGESMADLFVPKS
jgi:hypothetical protein